MCCCKANYWSSDGCTTYYVAAYVIAVVLSTPATVSTCIWSVILRASCSPTSHRNTTLLCMDVETAITNTVCTFTRTFTRPFYMLTNVHICWIDVFRTRSSVSNRSCVANPMDKPATVYSITAVDPCVKKNILVPARPLSSETFRSSQRRTTRLKTVDRLAEMFSKAGNMWMNRFVRCSHSMSIKDWNSHLHMCDEGRQLFYWAVLFFFDFLTAKIAFLSIAISRWNGMHNTIVKLQWKDPLNDANERFAATSKIAKKFRISRNHIYPDNPSLATILLVREFFQDWPCPS